MRPMATIEQEALVSLTEGAATKIRELMAGEPAGEAEVLRIAVQGGGCSGFEYALGFDTGVQDLRARGFSPEEVVGQAAAAMGLLTAGSTLAAAAARRLFED